MKREGDGGGWEMRGEGDWGGWEMRREGDGQDKLFKIRCSRS